jgi:hypothetical protein
MLTQLPATAKQVAVQSRHDRDYRSFPPKTKGFGRDPDDIGLAIN